MFGLYDPGAHATQESSLSGENFPAGAGKQMGSLPFRLAADTEHGSGSSCELHGTAGPPHITGVWRRVAEWEAEKERSGCRPRESAATYGSHVRQPRTAATYGSHGVALLTEAVPRCAVAIAASCAGRCWWRLVLADCHAAGGGVAGDFAAVDVNGGRYGGAGNA